MAAHAATPATKRAQTTESLILFPGFSAWPGLGLLGALPDQFAASARRAGGNAVLQLIAGNAEGPSLGGAIPVGIGAGLDVESERLVLFVHGVLAEMRDASRDDGLILFRGSFGAIVRA